VVVKRFGHGGGRVAGPVGHHPRGPWVGSVRIVAAVLALGVADEAAARVALIDPDESLFKTGGDYLRGMILLAASWMAGTTATLTVGAVLYNLLADLVGGIEFTVLEEVPVDTSARHAPGGRSIPGGI